MGVGEDQSGITSAVEATVPSGWQVAEHWHLSPEDPGVRIEVDVQPDASGELLGHVVGQDGDALRSDLISYSEETLEWFAFRGAPAGVLREFSWTAQDGGRHHELRLYAVADHRRLLVRASAPEGLFSRHRLTFLDFLTQLSVRSEPRAHGATSGESAR
ncbi:MAG: hypothetical protein IPL43_04885 [Micropruina sp.]|nr:hypothetical protein [Micropruina sp.]